MKTSSAAKFRSRYGEWAVVVPGTVDKPAAFFMQRIAPRRAAIALTARACG